MKMFWLPSAISFLAVVATFFGILFTNRVNANLQERKFRSEERSKHLDMLRGKGEELFLLVSEFEAEFRHKLGNINTQYLAGKTWDAFEDANLSPALNMLLQIEMLTRVYFPNGNAQVERLVARIDERGKYLGDAMDFGKREGSRAESVRQLLLWSADIAEYAGALQKVVIRDLDRLHAAVRDSVD